MVDVKKIHMRILKFIIRLPLFILFYIINLFVIQRGDINSETSIRYRERRSRKRDFIREANKKVKRGKRK
jgi:hypothetical protein